ncbi:arsenate reductase [Modicisalibacter muralis]|uniref:Arsenate reductase n=1 Tax=Modicisalibacter muralis TaxID=119000 RepID=A0A1G9GGS8_9GAMM|nr:arsenate reductase family protein [Halomonas muralis]SDK99866.1 arsenate reductase [Halomonas muralis]
MATLTFYHNPRCSKSREALALLEARGTEFTLRRYLDEPLSLIELQSLAARLVRPVESLVRTNEDEWKALALSAPGDEQRLQAIAQYPRLLQRPLLDNGDRAIIGRPPEAILTLLDEA